VAAHAQLNGNLQIAQSYYGAAVPATDQQQVRVTVGNPSSAAPTDTSDDDIVIIVAAPGSPGGHVKQTLGPGESLTYTLDPREVGVLVDPTTGLRHVRVGGRITAVVVDPSDSSPPQPMFLIELLNRRTGKLDSFLAFPGFSGGVVVASGD
jgi:hypothetical protein